LTFNPNELKILQTLFAKPAPVKGFERVGEGGIPLSPDFPKLFPEWNCFTTLNLTLLPDFF